MFADDRRREPDGIGFGLHQVRRLIMEACVDEAVVQDVLADQMGHVTGIFVDIEGR